VRAIATLIYYCIIGLILSRNFANYFPNFANYSSYLALYSPVILQGALNGDAHMGTESVVFSVVGLALGVGLFVFLGVYTKRELDRMIEATYTTEYHYIWV
jgi:hypothetical protein